jgi:hypothetical protein
MKWAGNVASMEDRRDAYRVLVWRPVRKRPLERPKRRWENNNKMAYTGSGLAHMELIDLAKDNNR